MTITNIKELSKLIDLCRKKGIDSVEIDNIKLKLGPLDLKTKLKDGPDLMAAPEISNEDLLYWSATNLDGVG